MWNSQTNLLMFIVRDIFTIDNLSSRLGARTHVESECVYISGSIEKFKTFTKGTWITRVSFYG